MKEELTTAKYFNPNPTPPVPPLAPVSPLPVPTALPAPPLPTSGTGGLLRLCRTVSIFVGVAVVACSAALFWMHRDDIKDSARGARRRTSNPIDFMLWFGGSDKTFEDAIVEMQEREQDRWDEMMKDSEFQSEFDPVEIQQFFDSDANPLNPQWEND